MGDILFESDAWKIEGELLYGPIQTRTISRTIVPVETVLLEHQKQFDYWTWSEDYNSVYQDDPAAHPNVTHAMAKTTVKVPLIETGFVLNRSEKERAEVSKFNIAARLSALAPKIAQDEDRIAIYGDAEQDVTSFADTTNNSTALTTEINVTTEALTKTTMVKALSQLGTAMGGIENLKAFPIMFGVSPDVFDKMIQTTITGYAAIDRPDNILDYATAILLKYGGPGSAVWQSGNLGASVAKSSADKFVVTNGTLNSTFYPWDVNVASIVASPFRAITVDHAIRGMEVDMTERWVPVFRQKALVLYGGTTVIA